MKSCFYFGFILLCLISLQLSAQEKQIVVPYTLADRDRAIITEAKLNSLDVRFESINGSISSLETKMDVKFDSINSRIDYLFWLLGVLFTLMIFMLGYIIWDRRTAMKPALEQAMKADENSRNLITMLREYSKKHPDLAEILRIHGML